MAGPVRGNWIDSKLHTQTHRSTIFRNVHIKDNSIGSRNVRRAFVAFFFLLPVFFVFFLDTFLRVFVFGIVLFFGSKLETQTEDFLNKAGITRSCPT